MCLFCPFAWFKLSRVLVLDVAVDISSIQVMVARMVLLQLDIIGKRIFAVKECLTERFGSFFTTIMYS